jgi:hypothetical protein
MDSEAQIRTKGLLLVGGASRNVGKTTLVSNLIRHFSKMHKIVALKVKSIYDNDQFFHGNDIQLPNEHFLLIEEFELENEKDSSWMLQAGANRAFRLKVHHTKLLEAFQLFMNQIKEETLIICESNSFRKVIIPDLYLFIKFPNQSNMKSSAIELEKYANRIIFTDGIKHDFSPNEIKVENKTWQMNNQQ